VGPKVAGAIRHNGGDGREREKMATGSSAATAAATVTIGSGRGQKVRPATVACSWCRREVAVPAKGRVPKWCGTSCRHRAWEQHRAAESGRSAVDVVERVVERIVTVQLPAPTRPTLPAPTPPAPAVPSAPTGSGWAPLLTELAQQLDTGRIYTRDLNTILPTFDEALQALNRRLTH